MPDLPYTQTIHHGIDPLIYPFDTSGGNRIVWVGRGVVEKGLGDALSVLEFTSYSLGVAVVLKDQWKEWYEKSIEPRVAQLTDRVTVSKTSIGPAPGVFSDAKLFCFRSGGRSRLDS